MAKAKKELPAEPIAEETVHEKSEFTINDTVLLENIFSIRFVDEAGNIYRLDGIPGKARGDYRLVRA